MKANKIQLDRLKQPCECVYWEGNKIYLIKECKKCKRNKSKKTNNTIEFGYADKEIFEKEGVIISSEQAKNYIKNN